MSDLPELNQAINELNSLWPLLDLSDPQREELLIMRNELTQMEFELDNTTRQPDSDSQRREVIEKLGIVIEMAHRVKATLSNSTQRMLRIAEIINYSASAAAALTAAYKVH